MEIEREGESGDRFGHRMRSLRLTLHGGKLRGKQSKAKEMDILNGLHVADHNHLDSEFGSKFSGSLETNKNTLDCIVLDLGQQKAYELIFRTKLFL